ncbi:hypothetical protein K505DRAFT_321023 [Melanomma pulvis-pyrius CBS 109.77]|uniref:C2H2-type domain-containing protein n=1 Tax=Melanomma pulvis-pyrius CBS 109.77 TaxID=1314802 RepID=A0A6A6XU81_9PLEO|nr:hypothetical protein K505DRAFT_321023 [Melanomma pulvis-pyrius CBS 109.77]
MGIKRSRDDSVSSSEAPESPYTPSDVKIVHLDGAAALSHPPAVMKCSLPPHQPLTFASFDDYDVHYQKTHVHRCQECRKNFPDDHFLHLHIAENHDPISAAKRDRGEKMYACLIPTCPRPCSTPQKRRLHMIDKHQFPRDYDFFIVNNGIDRRNSMLRPQHRRRSSAMSVNGGASGAGRRRGESSASVMSVVNDTKKEDDDNEEEDDDDDDDDDESSDEESSSEEAAAKPKRPTPSKPTPPQDKASSSEEEDEEETSSEEESDPTPPKQKAPTKPAKAVKHSPLKLRGRGGFGRVGQRNTPATSTTPAAAAPTKTAPKAQDPIDSLTSGMSALQFIPNSVRKARERAKSNAIASPAVK